MHTAENLKRHFIFTYRRYVLFNFESKLSDLKRVKKLKFAVLHYREIDLDSELLAFKRAQLLEEFKRRSSLNYETLYSARIKKSHLARSRF